VSWSKRFHAPIPLPDGSALDTLDAARAYILELPAATQKTEPWQMATEALILTAEADGPADFARMGLMQALFPRGEPVFDTTRKDPRWGRRKLARDR
jgi:hypothetical protein